MKLTATKFLAPLIEPFMDWFSPLSGLYSMIVLTLMCVGLALACKVMVGPIGWLHGFSRAVRRRHDDTPKRLGSPMKLLLSCLLLSALMAGAQPAQIILLRHAEKPDDPSAEHLSPRGNERAVALVSLLGRNSLLTSNAPVAALYASRVTKHDRGHRTGETVAPLSKDLSLPVNTAYDSDKYSLLALSVLNNPAYSGKTVIVCWTHHDLAQLAGALGVRPQPDHWKDKTFDRLWVVSYREGHAELRDVPQRLLKGDSKR